ITYESYSKNRDQEKSTASSTEASTAAIKTSITATSTTASTEVNKNVIKDGNKILKKKYVYLTGSAGNYKIVAPGTKGATLYITDNNGVATKYTGTSLTSVKIYYKGKDTAYLIKKGVLYTGLYTNSAKSYCYVKGKKYVGKLKSVKSMDNKNIKYFTYKISGKTYAFNGSSVMYKNQIIGSYYYDTAGVRNTDTQIKQAVTFVKKHGGSKNKRSAKLKKCFTYLASRKHYSHDSDHTAKLCTTSGLPKAANKMLKNPNKGKGNCFGWASAYAYIAKVLGYEARVCKGTTRLRSGGMGPHGWTMVKYNGSWKICDANMHYQSNSYMKTYKNYPFKIGKSKTYFSLTAKNGKATWKKL
ncbi:MAG: transglutaminase-like domain-containing protein, partial [Lachnospiraceae bacterium]|nr:transglutaminase-like domain-containing protein [Lachnospiraceae bacterium]